VMKWSVCLKHDGSSGDDGTADKCNLRVPSVKIRICSNCISDKLRATYTGKPINMFSCISMILNMLLLQTYSTTVDVGLCVSKPQTGQN